MHIMRPELVRALLFLLIVLGAAWMYEWSNTRDWIETVGEVVEVRRASGGSTGDPRAFTVRFHDADEPRHFVTRRGITEQFGRFRDLGPGDEVPVLFDPVDSSQARLATVLHVFPFSVTVGMFTLMFLVVVVYQTARGRTG